MVWQRENTIQTDMYIEVFKTNIQEAEEADKLLEVLLSHFPECSFNFDLDDCDKILRAKGRSVIHNKRSVIDLVASSGHQIEILPD